MFSRTHTCIHPNAHAFILRAHLERNSQLVKEGMLATLMQMVVFEEVDNYWSLSRPIACIAILDRQAFLAWAGRLAVRQTDRGRQELQQATETLLDGLDAGPLVVMKEGFTQKLTKFQLMVSRHCVPMSD